ncbi:carbohydrate-binding protein [Undibacterium sp. Di27W]|uniref:carbohydrate-binding protein n=1 Tax=Undibacterium sp. Di27W TaxID=3413036 RepID=UPI003BF318AB
MPSISRAIWSNTQIYTQGNCVTYQRITYQAKWWMQGNVPGTEQCGPWEVSTVTPTPTPTPASEPASNQDQVSNGVRSGSPLDIALRYAGRSPMRCK